LRKGSVNHDQTRKEWLAASVGSNYLLTGTRHIKFCKENTDRKRRQVVTGGLKEGE